MKRPIVVSGGHLAPAEGFVSRWKQLYPDIPIIFVGRSSAFDEKKDISVEASVMKQWVNQVIIFPFDRLRVSTVWKFQFYIRKVAKLLNEQQPKVVVDFGSYVGLTVGLAAVVSRIPLILHEQTRDLSGTIRILSPLAKAVCLSWMPSREVSKKEVITGLPIRMDILHPPKQCTLPIVKKPIVYITGGTTGSTSINTLIFDILPSLVSMFTVVHQTGDLSYNQAEQLKRELPDHLQDRYISVRYVASPDCGYLYRHAALVISRSGANTVGDLAVHQTPTILIPLPWSARQEQMRNAQWLNEVNPCLVVDQTTLTSDSLMDHIRTMVAQREKTAQNSILLDGATRLCNVVYRHYQRG